MSASDYVNIDETLEIGDVFTEDKIVALVTGIEDTEEGSDTDNSSSDPPFIVPTTTQAIEAARILHSYFDSKGDKDSIWQIVGLEAKLDEASMKNKVQTTSDKFFI